MNMDVDIVVMIINVKIIKMIVNWYNSYNNAGRFIQRGIFDGPISEMYNDSNMIELFNTNDNPGPGSHEIQFIDKPSHPKPV